jgi:hypothetical protein
MPAYAKDSKVVCFFQSAAKFKSRYATLGFNDTANLDEGAMWPTRFALTELTAADDPGQVTRAGRCEFEAGSIQRSSSQHTAPLETSDVQPTTSPSTSATCTSLP